MKSRKATFFLIISMVAWGSLYPLSKHLMLTINPLFTSFLRYFVGVIPMIPLFIRERMRHPVPILKKEILSMIVLGSLGITGFALFLFLGIDLSTASNAALLTNTQPIFAAILAPILIKEVFSLFKLAGIGIGLIGIILVTTGGNFHTGLVGSSLIGNLILLLAALSMTLYNIYLKNHIRKFGGLVTTFITMSFGTVILFLIVLCFGGFNVDFSSARGTDILLIIYMGIGATALPYLLFNRALRETDVVSASGFKFLIPVSGILLSWLFIGETPTLWGICGTILVIVSVFFIQKTVK